MDSFSKIRLSATKSQHCMTCNTLKKSHASTQTHLTPVSWGCRIHRLHLGRGVRPLSQQSWSFRGCRVPLHCHGSQIHSGPEWKHLVVQRDLKMADIVLMMEEYKDYHNKYTDRFLAMELCRAGKKDTNLLYK